VRCPAGIVQYSHHCAANLAQPQGRHRENRASITPPSERGDPRGVSPLEWFQAITDDTTRVSHGS
jgi:hypothetical protein